MTEPFVRKPSELTKKQKIKQTVNGFSPQSPSSMPYKNPFIIGRARPGNANRTKAINKKRAIAAAQAAAARAAVAAAAARRAAQAAARVSKPKFSRSYSAPIRRNSKPPMPRSRSLLSKRY